MATSAVAIARTMTVDIASVALTLDATTTAIIATTVHASTISTRLSSETRRVPSLKPSTPSKPHAT
eukprot:3391230-Rhodomonas_salina.1